MDHYSWPILRQKHRTASSGTRGAGGTTSGGGEYLAGGPSSSELLAPVTNILNLQASPPVGRIF